MCLYPTIRKNPKYRANKKNGGNVPEIKDPRVGYVPIGCGVCMDCLKQKALEWRIRIAEETKTSKNRKFVTLTISDEAYVELEKGVKMEGYALDNEVATKAMRYFLERWRRKFGESVRHWFITELGQKNTERIHLHGILWTDEMKSIEERWNAGEFRYGWVRVGKEENGTTINYVNEETASYITKYVMKTDPLHKAYKPKILCTKKPAIGKGFIDSANFKRAKYKEGETKEEYVTSTGHKVSIPMYYRNKIYTEEEREKLWIEKLDKNVRYVHGEKVKGDNEKEYYSLLEYYRRINREMGYGSPEDWTVIEYENQRRVIKQEQRRNKVKADLDARLGRDGSHSGLADRSVPATAYAGTKPFRQPHGYRSDIGATDERQWEDVPF